MEIVDNKKLLSIAYSFMNKNIGAVEQIDLYDCPAYAIYDFAITKNPYNDTYKIYYKRSMVLEVIDDMVGIGRQLYNLLGTRHYELTKEKNTKLIKEIETKYGYLIKGK